MLYISDTWDTINKLFKVLYINYAYDLNIKNIFIAYDFNIFDLTSELGAISIPLIKIIRGLFNRE
jgi:uncharacterized PurR-regulated membrane protein YhhQ (DUF165 family)